MTSYWTLVVLMTVLESSQAFVVLSKAAQLAKSRASSLSALHALPKDLSATEHLTNKLVSGFPLVTLDKSSVASSSLVAADALDTFKNAALIVGAIIALVAVGVIAFASWVVPQAAAELEKQIQERDPDLWEEYQAKLEDGEVLSMRPDLMQELGDKYQKMVLEEYDAMERTEQEGNKRGSVPTAVPTADNTRSNVVDAEFVEESKFDKEK